MDIEIARPNFAPTKFEGVDFFNTQMWDGGPLREMAATKILPRFIPYAKTVNGLSFAGRYVCDGCGVPSNGVRRQNVEKMSRKPHPEDGWLCDSCRKVALAGA